MADYKILEVGFEIDAQKRDPCRFSIPQEVCDFLGISYPDDVLIEVSSGKGITRSNTKLKSGTEIYGDGLQHCCDPKERIRVRVTKA